MQGPEKGELKSGRAKDRDKTCRPAHGHYLLRLADGPTRELEAIEQSESAEGTRLTHHPRAAWLGKNAA